MDKRTLLEAIISQLTEEHRLLVAAATMAKNEATDAESQAKSKYETHAQEAAYLAEGQAKLATEIQESLRVYSAMDLSASSGPRVCIGSLIEMSEGKNGPNHFFFGPRNGGLEIRMGESAITVVTPQSPIGKKLYNKIAGDRIELPSPGGLVSQTIKSVR